MTDVTLIMPTRDREFAAASIRELGAMAGLDCRLPADPRGLLRAIPGE